MSLADLQNASHTETVNNTPVVVYGLSANDIAGIILNQLPSIEPLFDIVERHGVKSLADLAKVDMRAVGQAIVAELPDFIAHVIAYAAHEPEHAGKVLQIPAPKQVKLLVEVCRLTFEDAAGFREFLGNVTAAMRAASAAKPQLRQFQSLGDSDSQNGGSESEKPSLS